MNLERFTKTNKKISTALMQMALMATSFSASAASAAYYSGRRGAYGSAKNKSYLVDSSFGGGSRNLFKQSKVAVNQPKPVEINHADDLAILRSPVKELLVVDHNIKGYQQFSALLKPGVELLEIPQGVDGFAFLLNKLSQYQGLQAIHLFSHANAGELLLGNTIVDTETLKSNTEFAKVINQSVRAGGDFLLYGCELGKGQAGDEFLQIIKSNTHADVAASNNLTGNKAFNADWDLEIQKGTIEAKPLANSIAMKDFTEVLQNVVFQPSSWTVVNSGVIDAWGGTASNSNAQVSQNIGGVSRTLTIDGEYSSTGVYNGVYKGIAIGRSEKSITLSFTDGSVFTPVSIHISTYPLGDDPVTITTNKGGSLATTLTYTGYGNPPQEINLSSLNVQGATSLTITNNSWAPFATNQNSGLNGRIEKITFKDIGAAAPPAITTSATPLSDFSTCAGTASAIQNFTVSGSNLTANIVVTAPTGFEVSTASGSGYGNTVTLTPSSGAVSTTTIYIRLKSSATGTPSGNITIASSGVTTKNIAVSGTVKTVPATPAASSNSPVATGGTINLSTPDVSGATYNWTGPNGFSSSVRNLNITNITAAAAGTYSVTVTVNGCTSAAGTTVVTVNSAPTVSLSSGATAFTEGTAVVIDNALTVTDADNTTLASATVSITGGFQSGQDVLSFTNQNGITGSYNAGTGVLSLSGSSSLANYQAALRSVRYNNTSDNPNTANRTISFVVNDGTASSTAATKTISVTAANTPPVNTTPPAISGIATVGNALSISKGEWADADGDAISYSYQWYRADDNAGTNLALISGATNSSYTLTTNDAHKYLRVVVTANDGNGGTQTAASIYTQILNSAPVNGTPPSISGTATVGNALSTTNGTWSDADGDGRTYSYQWYRADDNAGTNLALISGATNASYILTTNDAHKYLRVVVTANDGNGGIGTATSTYTQILNSIPINSAEPSISGTATVGNLLSTTNGTWSDADGDGRTYSYQWYRADDNAGTNLALISGATNASYTLTTNDAHKYLRVVVTANDGNGGMQTAASTYKPILNSAPTAIGLSSTSVNQSGGANAVVGALSTTDADGDTAFSYSLESGIGDTHNSDFNISGSSLRVNNAGNLTAGTYSVRIRTADAGGATFSKVFTITLVDDVKPTVVSIATNNPGAAAPSVEYTVNFSEAVSGVDVSDFQLTTTNTAGGVIGSVSISGNKATVTVNSITGTGSLRLDLLLSANIQDLSGNFLIGGFTGDTHTVDRDAPNSPSAPLLSSGSDSGVSNTDGITNDNTPTFSGTAEAGSTVKLYDTDGTTVLGTGTATGGNWSITTTALSEGSHTITARATDAAGNASAASSGINVVIDRTSPTLAITSNKSTLKAGETATITFSFSEHPGATFTWNGSAGDVTVSGGTLSAISGTGLTRTATFTPTANTNNGTASITVAAASYTDVAGNSGGAGSTPSISYDTQAPAAPTGLAAVHGISQVALNWTANTEADLASYKIYGGDTTNPTTALTTVNAPATSYTHSGLTNGITYYYKITGVDAAGNESALSSEVSATPKATQTITFTGLTSKTYGDANFDLGAISTSGLPVTYTAADPTVVSISGNTVTILKAGSTKITASQAGDLAYEAATAVEQTLSVNAKALTATAQTVSKVYDGTNIATLTFNALTGLVGSDEVSVSYTSASYNDKHAGNNKSITINGLELIGAQVANYSLNTFSATGTITQKSINVTAQADTKVYDGTTASSVVPVVDALATGDAISTQPTQGYNSKHVGTGKTLTASGLVINDGNSGANYAITYVANNSGIITQKSINVTAQTDSKVYDGTTSSAVAPVIDALATGDAITTAAIQSYDNRNAGTAKTLTPVGLVINDGNSGANYAITYVANNSGIITQKSINVTAQTDSKVYDGTTSSAVAPVIDALATGDAISTAATQSYDNRNAGTGKTLTPAGLVINDGNSGANYAINYVANNSGIITQKSINVTAQTDSKVYDGTTSSTVAPVVEVLATGDAITTAATQSYDTKNAGTGKTLTPAGLVINDGNSGLNYKVSYVANTSGVINPAMLSYVATPSTKIYGDANPALTGNVTGFVSGDNQANATSGTLSFSTPATNASGIGSYAINGSGLTAANYTFGQAAGNAGALTVTARPITITADAKAKTYGDNDPALTYQITTGNLVNGDAFTGALVRDGGQEAGSYVIKQGTVLLSNNYNLSYQSADLTINKALLTVTANHSSRCYAAGNPAFSVSYSGFKYSDNENSLTTKPAVSTTANAGSAAGNYELVPSGATSANYDFSYVKGTLTVNPLPINTIASSEGTGISKGQTTVLTVNSDNGTSYSWSSASGIISGENSANLTVRPMETTTYTVLVRNANGCESISTITIEVKEDYMAVQAENFLTPNGDGVNDNWVIKNIDAYPDHTLSIYDRSGRELYKVRNYKNDWNGTFNGMPLAEGTYYYIIRFDQNQPSLKMVKGFITIVRSK